MNYTLLREVLDMLEEFESTSSYKHQQNLNGFKEWVADAFTHDKQEYSEPQWENKADGRSPESTICTMLVHMNRYAKMYSKAAIIDSSFSTQEDFIYLINLNAFGPMTKIELIKKNVQDKPTGMQIINRLLRHGWVVQNNSENDKRSKVVRITDQGIAALQAQMGNIRKATNIVSGDLSHAEKMNLIRTLQKLDDFHKPIFNSNIAGNELLDKVNAEYLHLQN
ncbi:MarR family winged helix-turn-helix transcriptional regulator [Flavobacterium hauense]